MSQTTRLNFSRSEDRHTLQDQQLWTFLSRLHSCVTFMQICVLFWMNQSLHLFHSGRGIFWEVVEKVMQSHGILTAQTCMHLVYSKCWPLFKEHVLDQKGNQNVYRETFFEHLSHDRETLLWGFEPWYWQKNFPVQNNL